VAGTPIGTLRSGHRANPTLTVAVLLGLAAALCYGVSDYVGGLVSRRVHYAIIALLGYTTATVGLVLLVALSGSPAPTPEALFWGAVSGIGGALGTLALYRGLARGRMGVVAPLSGLGTAALPVIVGVALGDRPSALALLGIAAALPAIWLVSTTPEADDDVEAAVAGTVAARFSDGVVEGLLAGVGFAVLLVGLDFAGGAAGAWPALISEATGLVVMAVFLAAIRRSVVDRRISRVVLAAGLAIGLLGGSGVVLFHLSTQEGLLSIVAVLTSLYPAVTVVLAAALLREPIHQRQAIGLALAVVAVVLIVAG
jgi:drug/metabolite transporter (DMT)-like permease